MIVKVPLVLQMENSECGAASLAMILKYFGKNVPLEQLRIDCGVSRNGVTAKGIAAAAKRYGLKCRAFRAEPGGLTKVNLPAVIHWDMGHFVVLRGIRGDCFFINDPAVGKIKVYEQEFDKRFTGIVLTFEKTEEFVEEKRGERIGFTIGQIKKCLLGIAAVSLIYSFVSLCSMILPLFHSVYIDDVILDGNRKAFYFFSFAVIILGLITFFGGVMASWLNEEEEKRINRLISVGFMEKIFKLPMNFFYQRTAGELTNRQIGSFDIARLVCRYLTPMLFQALLAVLYLTAAFFFNVYIAFVGAAAIFLNAAVSVYTSENVGGITAVAEKNKGIYGSSVSSAADMIETIKSCACEDTMFAVITGTAALSAESKAKADSVNVVSASLFYAINLIVSVAILLVAVSEILDGNFSVGGAVGAIGLTTAFFAPIGEFISSIPNIFELRSIAARTDDTMFYKEENIFMDEGGTQEKVIDGTITAEGVWFAYSPDIYAVKDLNFKLEKGKSIAFTGGSGSGKSTAAKLLSGLYKENKGRILYGNAEKSEIKKEYFYSKVAVVNQNVKLYEGTVFENITMWDDTRTYEEVVSACMTACIHDDIVSRKDAYYERITEGGKNFSGGQRQRFEIARAILKKPEILVLDEATSALDVATEKQIMENIRSMGVTLVIIAHRLSTIKLCDNIMVFNDGEVTEEGTYNELMDRKGLFHELANGMGE